jgi:hypothetical protein
MAIGSNPLSSDVLARGDPNRDKLLKPVLEIGTVPIDGGTPAVTAEMDTPTRSRCGKTKSAR